MNKGFIRDELQGLKEQGLLRTMREVYLAQGPRIVLEDREVINLCSNNYLGLADHPALKKAAQEAIEKYGVGCSASRLISGTTDLHVQLEKKIAEFKGTEAALVFNSGYVANIGIISALVGRGDVVFSDKFNHASIVDGCLLSGAEVKRYPHCDTATLGDILKKCHSEGAPKGRPKNLMCPSDSSAASQPQNDKRQRRLIVTDTVFSMDGDIAPLPEIVKLAKKYDCLLMIDEAHATGVLGENGKGAVEYFGLEAAFRSENFIQMGTLSKALGGFGAYVAGSKDMIDYLINKSRPFIYTTALPAAVIAAAIAALNIMQSQPQLRHQLWDNVKFFKDGLKKLAADIMQSETQIIPILIGDSKKAVDISTQLLEQDAFIQAIRPPTVPNGQARLRITIMATHTKEDLTEALGKIALTIRNNQAPRYNNQTITNYQ